MHIGMTGTRFGLSGAQAEKFREILKETHGTLHHGDCVGADADCHDIARELGWKIVIHPPYMDKLRANKKGDEIRKTDSHLRRNRAIVAESELLVAAPAADKETRRSGTWYTIRHALEEKVAVLTILPDGTVIDGDAITDRFLPGRWGE